jgi:hypothetical protein
VAGNDWPPQYAEAFEANDIEVDLLGQLDDQVLKDIGVSSAGHGLRIRNAIAKLEPEATLDKNQDASGAATGTPAHSVKARNASGIGSWER